MCLTKLEIALCFKKKNEMIKSVFKLIFLRKEENDILVVYYVNSIILKF